MNEKDKVTILITHHNRLEKLKRNIRHIKYYTRVPYRVIIFNNGYTNKEIEEYFQELNKDSHINIIDNKFNVGPPASRFLLQKLVATPYALFLDDDVYVCPGWDNTLKLFENKEIGFVGFTLFSTDSRKLPDTRKFIFKNNVLSFKRIKVKKELTEVEEVPGGAMLVRKEALDDFSFDPLYFIGFADLDKTLQILNTKWKLFLVNKPFTHDRANDSEEYSEQWKNYKELRMSYLHFTRKWGLRFPLKQHILYKYVFNLPAPILSLIKRAKKKLK